LLTGGLGNPEVDHLHDRHGVVHGDQQISGFEIAMDDALLVGMLDRPTDRHKEAEAFTDVELALVAKVRNGNASNQLQDEVGTPGCRFAAVEHLGNVGMSHESKGLPLSLEAGYNLARIHAGLEHLYGYLPAHWPLLFGHEDHAKTAFAD